jgi:hypothetical protein
MSVAGLSDYPRVALVRLPANRGKARAVQHGLRFITSPRVLLVDADLQGLQAQEIEDAIQQIVKQPTIDMVILRRINSIPSTRLTRGDVLFSGERILHTQDLKNVLARSPENYQLEITLNQYMMDNDKCVYWMPSSATNTLKVTKHGWLSGLLQEVGMITEMLLYCGLDNYLQQLLAFARAKVPEPHKPGTFPASPRTVEG